MRFRYSFQKIVDLKSNVKTQAEWILSSAVGRLRDEESSLSELHSQKHEIQQNLAAAAGNSTTISELLFYQEYINHIDHKITSKHADVTLAKQNVAINRESLSAKMIEEKVWMKAREKAQELHSAAVLKKEQEALDEMATTRRREPSLGK